MILKRYIIKQQEIYKISKRYMHRCVGQMIYNATPLMRTATPQNLVREMAVVRVFNLSEQIAQETGIAPHNHARGIAFYCDEANCDTKKCALPCTDKIIKARETGNTSHSIPPEHNGECLDPSNDYQGNGRPQYYVESPTKVTLTPEQLQNLTEVGFKQNKQATDFANSTQEIFDKIKGKLK